MQYLKKYKPVLASLVTIMSLHGLIVAQPANAQQRSIAQLTDIDPSHWAYKAVKELVEKYGVLSGFDDNTFRGNKLHNRYEIAAILYKVMTKLGEVEDITKRIGNIALDDLKKLKNLQTEFQDELKNMKVNNEKIKVLEEELKKIKQDFGNVQFGGSINVSGEDVFQDNFRPGYGTDFRLSMRIQATDDTTINAALASSFSSIQEAQDDKDKVEEGKKSQWKENRSVDVGFGEAWFDHNPGGFLNPRVKFGYMGAWNLISTGTSVPHRFGWSNVGLIERSAIGLASPNVGGIRLTKSFIFGGSISEGPFSLAAAASPDVFFGMAKLDLGLFKLKLVSEGDQALFVGEIVQDTLHNHLIVADIGNDIFGISLQSKFRGLAEAFDWRGASGLASLSLGGFNLGASTVFKNEPTYQELIAGAFFQTPGNLKKINNDWPDADIPSFLFAIQSPFTVDDQGIAEGAPNEVGDLAGFMIQLSYDNPYIPNLAVEFSQKQKVFFDYRPDLDAKFDSSTISMTSQFYF